MEIRSIPSLLEFDSSAAVEFKHLLLNRRLALGYSRSDVAAQIGVKESTLRRIEENWKFVPDGVLLLRLLYVLDLRFVAGFDLKLSDATEMINKDVFFSN